MIGSPTFRSSAINAIAVIPLLSTSNDGRDDPTTHSSKSFESFLRSLHRHNESNTNHQSDSGSPATPDNSSSSSSSSSNSNSSSNYHSNVVVVVSNSNLTRPGDWKYNETPLRNFHWGHGCQRLRFFDGRPYHSRSAHDRLINHELTRNWIDLCPSRRTAALIGVLNVRDCPDQATLETAIQEWRQWAERYSTPPYEVTAHGRDVERDTVVPRLFVFDSFHEDFVNNPKVDLQAATENEKFFKLSHSNNSLVAFPPSDSERSQMMDLHVNVVVNDLTVAIFRELEGKIRESDSLMTTTPTTTTTRGGSATSAGSSQSAVTAKTGFFGRSNSKVESSGEELLEEESAPMGTKKLSIDSLAAVVSSTSELASPEKKASARNSNNSNDSNNMNSSSNHSGKGGSGAMASASMSSSVKAQLLTPLDEFLEYTELSPKDAHMMMKRQVARRQKFTADLCLLAGSPLDAYERFTKAADLSKTTSPDPLWYASALEGCASVHIAMADVGGFNVDEYLESSFQLPEELMACALIPAGSDAKTSSSSNNNSGGGGDSNPNKKSMPQVILALCEDALNVTARHPKIACFHSELLLKLAWYTAEVEDVHVRCRWGMGGDDDGDNGNGEECCYGGDPGNDKRRWGMYQAVSRYLFSLFLYSAFVVSLFVCMCQSFANVGLFFRLPAHACIAFFYLKKLEMASATRLNFLELKNKDGEDVVQANTLKRLQKCSEFMHRAAASAALDPVTRADVALRCLAISWRGIRPTVKPTDQKRSSDRIQLKRKAAFFAVTAAEAMSDVHGTIPNERASAMWMQASRLLSNNSNNLVSGGNYGWATLRAVALHALVIQGTKELSEEAAKQLLMLVSEISPPNHPSRAQGLLLPKHESPEKLDGSGRNLSFAGAARSYIRDSAKEVRSRSKELFGNPSDMSSLVVVQSKWVEDDPLEPTLVPMGDFSSDFAPRVLELPSVWPTIRFENCAVAQERLVQQIYDLRKKIPASTLQNANSNFSRNNKNNNQKLPIEITSIHIVNPNSSLKLERVESKPKRKIAEEEDHSMATFFNPYAKQDRKIEPTTIPRGEEQYISVSFTNKLAIPFDVDACKVEFDTPKRGSIKAPSISFVVPGQTNNFAVRFPFIVLEKFNDEDINALEVKGIYITALSRSIFLPIGPSKVDESNNKDSREEKEEPIIPESTSLYIRRDYDKTTRLEDQKPKTILSPSLEITPPQPKLRVSFASSPTRMDDESIIPVLLADGEIFTLPKMCVSNDTGLDGRGTIEKLQISAIGLPGLSEVVLYDMSSLNEESNENPAAGSVKQQKQGPISISAKTVGMDATTLNSSAKKNSMGSFLAAKLFASPNMGAQTNGCDMTLRFRYRGKSVSSSLEVWRKYEVEIKILRVKGPRIPSLSFRCDLFWDSGYSELCHSLPAGNKPVGSYDFDISDKDNNEEFVANRLGRDPGIHVCSDKAVVMISVANESSSPIILTRVDGSPFGFPSSQMDSLKVSKGVSAKFPILLPRVDRSENVCQELIDMTKFEWRSCIPGSHPDDAQETGGSMFPANRRVRQGILELPFSCLKTIIDENPIFLSRICKAPCSIGVSIATGSNNAGVVASSPNAIVGKPVDVSVTVEMAKWLSFDLKKSTKCVLSFCCAKQNSSLDADKENRAIADINKTNSSSSKGFVWIGQTRKNLRIGETSSSSSKENEAASVHHQARIIFLEEGDYYVSACLNLSGAEQDDDDDSSGVKEVWWANKAAKMHVSRSTKR
jgi:hypothetical protein